MSRKAYVKNAADKKQVNDAKGKEKEKRRQELDDIREVLSTPGGRRFFLRYIEDTGIFKESFTGNSETFFKEGRRSVGLDLIADMNMAMPEAYVLMLKEKADAILKDTEDTEDSDE